ncbi:hypothetical protein [Xanthomonas graminis]|nr:hypothetical protein [Xanthomonas translucens]
MTFVKFEGNWKSRNAGRSFSFKIEIGLSVSAILAVLHLLLS